jgi:hypothetical protein
MFAEFANMQKHEIDEDQEQSEDFSESRVLRCGA